MSNMFSIAELGLLVAPKPLPILKLKPGQNKVVQLGSAQFSRRLVPLHYDLQAGRSASCSGSGICKRCIKGMTPRVFLYLAARTHNGAKVIVCVSRVVANEWLYRAPDFHHQFSVERPNCNNAPTTLREITTHGRFQELWEGFDLTPELDRLFGWEYRS